MSEGDTSASTIVRQTRKEYEEMRRKLAETEKKLNRLARLEAREQSTSTRNAPSQPEKPRGANPSQGQKEAGDSRSVPDFHLSEPSASVEDVASLRSELSTVPGSYTGFVSRPFPASTPNTQALPRGDGQPATDEMYDSDSSGSGHQGVSGSNNSVKLLRQNQRLLSEVERLVCELQAAKHRQGELSLELESCQGQRAELNDRVEELQAEIEAQDKALRSAEQHLAESQKQMSGVQQDLSQCQHQVHASCKEIDEERKLRTSVEAQRDEAVQNFLEAQEALEDFQRTNRDRVKKLEESEDHLRDSLAHTNAERDELLQKVDSLQSSATASEAEIERLLAQSAMEQETKKEIEAQNLDLRRQLAKLTTRLHKSEEESLEVSTLRQENAALCSEVEQNRDLISQLEDMVDHMRRQRMMQQAAQLPGMADDSGNSSIHLGTSMQSTVASSKGRSVPGSQGEGRRRGAEGNCNNNGSTIGNLLTELRSMLFEMDDEMKRLRSRISSQEEERRAMQDLRGELSLLMGKAVQGEEHAKELEQVVGRLEADKASLVRQVHQNQSDQESRDAQILTLEARLAQRNSQIIELQEDLNGRCEAALRLEKELWKKSACISQLESLLEEKGEEVKDNDRQVTRVRHDFAVLEDELKAARNKLKTQQMDLDRCRSVDQENQATHSSQCRQYERQIEKLHAELEKKDSYSTELQHLVQRAQQDSADKDQLIQQLETTLLETKQVLNEVTSEGQESLRKVENKLSHSSQHVQQLESALLLCRNEISEHLSSMEHTRQKFDTELSKREHAIERLEKQLRSLQTEVVQRTEDNVQLEREVVEKRTAVQHYQSRLSQLEHSEATLKDTVKQLEHQLLTEKGQWMMEADQLERKLGGQSADLDTALAKISDLKQTIKELQEENRQTESERLSLERALQSETSSGKSNATRISHLEKELRDLRVELEQKIETVCDLEDTVRNKDADLEQQRSLVEQLDVDKLHMQRGLKQLEDSKLQQQETVQRLQFDSKAKEQMLTDTREMLRKTQGELTDKSIEATDLREALEERQRELEERVVTMQKLERTVHETHDEMSQRMQRVDNTLHKYEAEIKERTGQIADLDDRLKLTQTELVEKSRQLQLQQQLAQRQDLELQATTLKLDELDNTNMRQKQRLEEQKAENVEVTQELRLTREQLQTQHAEFLSARRELAASRREVERLSRELEEVGAAQRCKDHDTARLSEELGASQARAAQAEAKLSAQSKQHQRELAELADKYKEDTEALKRSREEAEEHNTQTLNKLGLQAKQLSENERLYRQRLDTARSELEALHNELSSRKEVIRSANEAIFMKDSEIARLKAQVSRYERHGHSTQNANLALTMPAYQDQPAMSSAGMHDSHPHHPVLHSSVKEGKTNTAYNQHHNSTLSTANSSQHYYLSSGPLSPLSRHDLSNNADASSSHNTGELPMKDTWDDKDGQEYSTDHLVFSFERLGAGLAQPGAGSVSVTDREVIADETVGKSGTKMVKTTSNTAVKDKRDTGDKKGGGGAVKSASVVSSGKSHPSNSRTASAPTAKWQAQNLKVSKKKGKALGVRFQGKKGTSGKGEKVDYSHHHKDPETLVSTYKSEVSPSLAETEMEDLQQQLQANSLRQQEIERQLRSLEDSGDSPAASDSLSEYTIDQ